MVRKILIDMYIQLQAIIEIMHQREFREATDDSRSHCITSLNVLVNLERGFNSVRHVYTLCTYHSERRRPSEHRIGNSIPFIVARLSVSDSNTRLNRPEEKTVKPPCALGVVARRSEGPFSEG